MPAAPGPAHPRGLGVRTRAVSHLLPPPLPPPLLAAPRPQQSSSARPPAAIYPTSAAPPLQAAVAAATRLIRVGTNPPATTTLPSDGAGIPGPAQALADVIQADFGRLYFVTGDLDGRAYARGVSFVDPTVTVAGLSAWRANIASLKPFLIDPTIELEGGTVEVVEGSAASTPTLRAAWRLKTAIALPWRPVVDVRGETVYETEGVNGARDRLVVVRHTESWRTPAWRAVGQLFRPGG